MSTPAELRADRTGCATWHEIHAQPDIWRKWAIELAGNLADHRSWISACGADEIWLTGAGTSAYIGDLIAAALSVNSQVPVRSIASTDLVSAPRQFIRADRKPLVVSFGRSGNSTESIGVLDVLDALLPEAPRLNICCNAESILATRVPEGSAQQRIICLPPETHDSGFAMTSSYTTMVLTALALFDPAATGGEFSRLAQEADRLLPVIARWADAAPVADRIVFNGSGALRFAAREAALIVMELSAGQVPALWDSALGFRHGPKAFVTGNTLVVAFVSADRYTARYDLDLTDELRAQFPGIHLTIAGPADGSDITIRTELPDHWNSVLYILIAQVLAVDWSAKLQLNVDNPFAGRSTLTRVVSGVTLYPPEEA